MVNDLIPRWERIFYWVFGVGGMAYAWWRVIVEIDVLVGTKQFPNMALEENWNIFGRKQDTSDSDWKNTKMYMPQVFGLIALHLFVSQLCRFFRAPVKVWTFLLLLCDLACLWSLWGYRVMIAWMLKTLLVYLGARAGGAVGVWIVSVCFVLTNHGAFEYWKVTLLNIRTVEFYQLHIAADSFLHMRLISFGIETAKIQTLRAQQEAAKKTDINLKDIDEPFEQIDTFGFSFWVESLLFLFYLPSFVVGPVRILPEFKQQMTHHFMISSQDAACKDPARKSVEAPIKEQTEDLRQAEAEALGKEKSKHSRNDEKEPALTDETTSTKSDKMETPRIEKTEHTRNEETDLPRKTESHSPDYKDIFKNIARVCFWAVFLELCQHIFYFSAVGYIDAISRLTSLWAATGVAHVSGQFFMVKYLVYYGFFGQLGRFDGLVAPAEPPCISLVYSYSDIWKHFDVGLYNFVKHYIFIPLGGSRSGIWKQMASTGLVFFFICLYHGADHQIRILCFANYAIIILETLARLGVRSSLGQTLVAVAGPSMMLRLKCLLHAFLWIVSSTLILVIIMSDRSSWLLTQRTFVTSTWTEFFTFWGVVYACVQNAIYLRGLGCLRKKMMR